MTTTQMAYFLSLSEKLNFTEVAEQFYVTQPTLSRQIMNLEADLGVRLFVRKNNVVSLTMAGKEFKAALEPVYEQLERLINDIRHYETRQRQTFTIGVGAELLMDDAVQLAVGVLGAENSDVHIVVTRADYAELSRGLNDGTINVANTMAFNYMEEDSAFSFLCIEEEPVYLACPAGMRSTLPERLTPADLRDILSHHKLLLGSSTAFGRPAEEPLDILIEALNLGDITPAVVFQSSPLSIPSQVAAGLGVSLCNRSNLFSIDPQVAIVPIDVGPRWGTRFPKGILYRKDDDSPLLRRFVELVKSKIR